MSYQDDFGEKDSGYPTDKMLMDSILRANPDCLLWFGEKSRDEQAIIIGRVKYMVSIIKNFGPKAALECQYAVEMYIDEKKRKIERRKQNGPGNKKG